MTRVLMEKFTRGGNTVGGFSSEFKLYSPYDADGTYEIVVCVQNSYKKVRPEIRCRIICPDINVATAIWQGIKQGCWAVT